MKYLIINGSPNINGNTMKVILEALRMIKGIDLQAAFHVNNLIEEKLPFCLGCSTCFRLGHEKCPHNAIIVKLMQAIEQADGVIVASPAFNMRETALLKNFFDHLCFMLHRPHFFRSKALVITTVGGVGGRSAAKSIASFLKGIGFNRVYTSSTTTLSWNDYRVTEKAKVKLEKVVRRFHYNVASKKLHNASALEMIPYNLFRGMSLHCQKGSEYETEDGVYWLDENRKNSLYDRAVPVPFFKRPVGHLFYLIGKMVGKKTIVTYRK